MTVVERDVIKGLVPYGVLTAKHLADSVAGFGAQCYRYDTRLEEDTTLTARAAFGCGHSPTSSPRSLGRAAAPTYTSVLCHTGIRMRVLPYVA
ncbi:unnamed protein product [Arctia plantaginis]|uniref:Uncharacterized protein n=1 Tax=Arctia plantaginis TaxID=874455 RepID=A0A8S1A5K0_ARCPL|nr:unnamed protein product [Arctia plantaginis]